MVKQAGNIKNVWYNSKVFRFLFQFVGLTIGFWMLVLQMHLQVFDLLVPNGGNVWNSRFFVMISFLFISISFAWCSDRTGDRMYRFMTAFFCLTVIYFGIGGFFITNDTYSASATAIATNNEGFWLAFDAFSIGSVGMDVMLITQAIVYAVPVAVMLFTVISIFHGDTNDEYQSAILEGMMAFVFLVVYAWMGSFFGWFI